MLQEERGTYIGYGFAIPINLAKSVAKDLISTGKVNRGYIGVNIGEVDNAMAKSLGLDRPHGVIIQGIIEGGAASATDLKSGDVILKIDGKEVNQPNELQSYIASKTAGNVVTLEIFRDGKEMERKVTLKAREDNSKTQTVMKKDDNGSKNEVKESTASFENIGLVVKNPTEKEKNTFDIDSGVLITDVTLYSKAYDQGLFKDLVIIEADRKPVKDVTSFTKIIESRKGEAVLLKIQDSKGNTRFVGLEIPK